MENNSEIPLKKRKLSELDLRSFQLSDVINSKPKEKMIVLKGKFENIDGDCIIILEKSAFSEDDKVIQKSLKEDKFELKSILENDIYGSHIINNLESLNYIKITSIYPATQKHIDKFSKPRTHTFMESSKFYLNCILPLLKKDKFSTEWVDNLIDGDAEKDRIIFRTNYDKRDSNFVVVPDYKWDEKTIENLHCLALVYDNKLTSLRNLSRKNLILLKEIYSKSLEKVSTKYGVAKSQIRCYIHYPPSFYHLHVHISHLYSDDSGALVDRAHLLSDIITNIELVDDYYQRVNLNVVVNENDSKLYHLYRDGECN